MNNDTYPIDFEVIVSEEKSEVYIRFTGFESGEAASDYADHLLTYLPLMLFESDVIH